MTEGLETVLDKDNSRTTMVSCTDAIEEYVKKSDWRVNANANSGYCNASLVNNLAGKITANYWLDKVYSKEEGDAHRNADYHIHDLDCLCPYCCGHDLQRLLNEGFNGVVDKVEANAPKHFREALYQMANYLGILQAEWAGAQAFSSFDTYLAPYVFFDRFYNGMTYTDIKKAILNFIYTLNVPARWGQCVPSTYRCLKGDGTWVTYQELKDGDEIYVVDMKTGTLKKDKITNVNIFNAPSKMHEYKDKHGFNFKVTPNHRVIYKVGSGGYQIKESKELTRYDVVGKAVINIPTAQWGTYSNEEIAGDEYDISDDLLKLVTYIMTDGVIAKQKGRSAQISWFKSPKRDGIKQFEELCSRLKIEYNRRKDDSSRADGAFVYEYRLHVSDVTNKVAELLGDDKHKFPKFVQYLSPRQCNLMLDIWTNTDGHKDTEHWKLQADSEDIQDMLAYLSVRTGKPVSNTKRSIGKNEKATIYTDIHKNINRECHVEEIEMSLSKVWCPTTNTGTFVCMTDEGYIFLTGNSPFTNVTIDWQVPTDMKTQIPLRNDMPYFESIFDTYLFDNPEKFKDEKFLSLANEALHRLGRPVGFSYERDDSPGNDDATKTLICDVIEEVLNELTYEHFQEEMNLINKAFYECMNDGDKTGKPFTFPIPTVSITEDFDWDGENTDLLFENAAKYGSSYFQNFIGSQYFRDENGKLTIPNPNAFRPDGVRSMCPLDYNEKVIVRSRWDAMFAPIGEVYNRHCKGTKYECFYNGEWIPAKVVKVLPQKLYHITLANNSVYKMGDKHEQPILRNGEKLLVTAEEILPGDMIPFNTSTIDAKIINSSYELGYAVGAYLGDGSKNESGITYSLDAAPKDDTTEKILRTFWEGMGYRVSVMIINNCRSVRVGAGSYDVIKKYFNGNSAITKSIASNILSQSVEMRTGLIDGYIATDGDRTKSRIWTSSKTMVEDLIAVFNSIGIKAYCSFKDTRDGRLGTNACYAVSYIKDRENYKGKYLTVDGQLYWIVTNVEAKDNNKHLYCLTTDSTHHLFTLKDGLVTHNCRLQLDLTQLRQKGGGLFGSGSQTGSIGVVTINMARLGYKHKGDIKALYADLDRLLDLAKSTLEKKRAFVYELNKRGLYPYTRRYIRTLDTFFSTIGVNGMNEMVRNFTNDEHDITGKFGHEMCLEMLTHIRNRLVEYQNTTGNLYNLEATPAEGTTYRLAKADKQRYGQKTKTYIECDVHGRVEVDLSDDSEYIECPLCREESNV